MKSDMCKALSAVLGIWAALFAAWFFIDGRYAKAEDVKMVEWRLDYKIQGDVLDTTQHRLWAMEAQYGTDPDKVRDPQVRQEMKELRTKVEQQRQSLTILEKSIKKVQ